MKIQVTPALFLLFTGGLLSAMAATPSSKSNAVAVPPDAPPDSPAEDTGGDPVGYEDGSVFVVEEDLRVACPDMDLVFRRAYGSWSSDTGSLGYGWTHSFEWRLVESGDGVLVYSAGERGVSDAVHRFDSLSPGHSHINPDGYRLVRSEDGKYSVLTPDALTYSFDERNRLASISAWNGTTISLERQAAGRLSRATHSCGKWLGFEYGAHGHLVRVNTPAEGVYAEFAVEGRTLNEVVRHDGGSASTNVYTYSEAPSPGKRDMNAIILPRFFGVVGGSGLHHVNGKSPYEGESPIGFRPRGSDDEVPPDYLSPVTRPAVIVDDGTEDNAIDHPLLASKVDANGIAATYAYVRPTDSPQFKCTHSEMDDGLFSIDLTFYGKTTVECRPTAWGLARTTHLFDGERREIRRETGAESLSWRYRPCGDLAGGVLTNSATGSFLEVGQFCDAFHNVVSVGVGFNASPSRFLQLDWDNLRKIPRREVSPAGRAWEWTLDGADVTIFGAGANDTRNVSHVLLNGEERPVAILPPDGGRLDIAYDESGYATNFAASCLPPVSLGYDALGHVSSIALPGPGGTCRPTTVTNNWRGNPLSVALPDGMAESFAYEGNGRRVVRHVDALGREDVFKWVFGLPVHAGRIVNGVTNTLFGVEHDRQLNVVAITDPLGRNAETYVLDENERVVAVTNVEGQAMSCEYAVGGFVSSVTRFDGTAVSYGYDADGNLATAAYPDSTLAFSYDGDGLLTSATNATGTVSNEYDAATGWLVSSQGADGTTVEYSRRNGGDVASVSFVAGETSYDFDDAGRWTGIGSPAGTFGLGYCDWNGRLAAVTNAHGLVTEYAYDIMDRVTNIAWRTTGGASLGGFAYAYDAAGRIVSRNHSLGGDAFDRQYAYDDLDRLVSDGGVSYAYDAAGNRTSRVNGGETVSYTRGVGDRLASWTGGSYSYNAAGCVTRIERTGRPTLDLAWNGHYQLVSVSTNGVFAEGYAYDALGRRVSTTNAGGTIRHVYDDNWQCIADIDEQGNVVASYVWGEGIDNLLAVKIGDETYYPLTDIQGTVWGYVDAGNNVVARWTYDAWGNVLDETVAVPALATLRYRFQGREWSTATALVNFRMRWYDPETGRWLSKDPIGLAGGLNLYAFCGDDPANANDPSGTDVVAIVFPVFAPSLPELGIGTSIVVGFEVGAGIGAFGMGFVVGQKFGAYTGLDEFMFDFGANIGNWISHNFAAEHTKNARPSTREKHQNANARRDREQRRAKENQKKHKKPKKHKKHQGIIIVIPDDEEDTQPCG